MRARLRAALHRLRRRLRDARGSMTVLTTGVLVVILMVVAVGASITGVHLERNGLQYAADSAALAASQGVDPSRLYTPGGGTVIEAGSARQIAEEHLRSYPHRTTRTEDIAVSDVVVDPDGTVHVLLTARTNPPLVGWFTRGTGTSVPLAVEGEARAR